MNIIGKQKAMTLLLNVLDTTKTSEGRVSFPKEKPIFPFKDNDFFIREVPERYGVPSETISDFAKELFENRSVGLQSLMVMRGDRVIFECETFGQDSRIPKATFSQCKSIVSLAIGILITRGKLKLSEKLTEIFSDKLLPITKMKFSGLTVKHILTMTAGVTFDESEALVTENWFKGYFGSDVEGEFGEKFKYNSLNTYILTAIIKERTGLSLCEFLDSQLFGPLEITDYYWEKCPMGLEKGGWGLYLRREDMAKLGLLVMQKGFWKGKKLISSKYIEDATQAQVKVNPEYGNYDYGFHIWRNREKDSFLFNGMLGQNLIGYRESGIMIIANCGNCHLFQQNDFFSICDKYFSDIFSEELDLNPRAFSNLQDTKRFISQKNKVSSFLSTERNKRDLESDMIDLDGRIFRISSPNKVSVGFMPLLWQLIQSNHTKETVEIRFNKCDDNLIMEFCENDEAIGVEIGFDEPICNTVVFHKEMVSVNVFGEFAVNEDGVPVLKVECNFIETPYKRVLKFFFDEKDLHGIFTESPGLDLARNTQVLFGLLGENRQRIENIFNRVDGDYLSVKMVNAFSPRVTFEEVEYSK